MVVCLMALTDLYTRRAGFSASAELLIEIAEYCCRFAIFSHPPLFDARGGEHRQNFVTIFGVEKTVMMGVPYGQKSFKIGFTV